MTHDDVLTRLAQVRSDVHAMFDSEDRLHEARLDQFDGALTTAAMAVEHLADEEVRHRVDPKAHLKALGRYVRED